MVNLKLYSADEGKKAKIQEIIDHQFDLEIYLKYREISAIREELGKAEEILIDIRQAVHNGTSGMINLILTFAMTKL